MSDPSDTSIGDDDLRRSMLECLDQPYPEARELAELGFDEWARSLPVEPQCMVDDSRFVPVCWVEGRGWLEGD
ncbi:MAG: hypothetical protein JWN04_4769 [Myxococcaceae bacterium]|nr:hypothetical protein [Myxococcaceae bacterium]